MDITISKAGGKEEMVPWNRYGNYTVKFGQHRGDERGNKEVGEQTNFFLHCGKKKLQIGFTVPTKINLPVEEML